MPNADQPDANSLRQMLSCCPPGPRGWKAYENAAGAALKYLFVPPLSTPHPQSRSYSGLDRRDAIFPNRVVDTSNPWGLLRHDLAAKLILVEFKNYDREEIGKEETDQTRNYLKAAWGRLAIICSNKLPNDAAHRRRNSIYSEEEKIILFITTADLLEMIDIKDRGDDPSEFIVDSIERFLIQHE
jgi:hypothetical protein